MRCSRQRAAGHQEAGSRLLGWRGSSEERECGLIHYQNERRQRDEGAQEQGIYQRMANEGRDVIASLEKQIDDRASDSCNKGTASAGNDDEAVLSVLGNDRETKRGIDN